MPKYEIDEDILETMLEDAYRRGMVWGRENPTEFSLGAITHAASCYADKTITEHFKS